MNIPPHFAFMRGLKQENWVELLAELGLSEMESHPHWANQGREAITNGRYGYVYRDQWNERFANFTVDEIATMFARHGGDVWRMNSYETLFAHPQMQYLDMVAEADHPTAAGSKWPASPGSWKIPLARSAWRRRCSVSTASRY